MKKIENALINFAQFLDEYCPNYLTFFLFILCGMIAFTIRKYRKKDAEDIAEQKAFYNIFNRSDCWIFDETDKRSN